MTWKKLGNYWVNFDQLVFITDNTTDQTSPDIQLCFAGGPQIELQGADALAAIAVIMPPTPTPPPKPPPKPKAKGT